MLCDGGGGVYASTYAAPTKYAKCQKWKIVSHSLLSSENYEWPGILGHTKLYHVLDYFKVSDKVWWLDKMTIWLGWQTFTQKVKTNCSSHSLYSNHSNLMFTVYSGIPRINMQTVSALINHTQGKKGTKFSFYSNEIEDNLACRKLSEILHTMWNFIHGV